MRQQMRCCLCRERFAEQETLYFVAPHLAQEGKLVFCLYSFGDQVQVQAFGHGNDRCNYRGIAVALNIRDTGLINFDGVDGEFLQIIK